MQTSQSTSRTTKPLGFFFKNFGLRDVGIYFYFRCRTHKYFMDFVEIVKANFVSTEINLVESTKFLQLS